MSKINPNLKPAPSEKLAGGYGANAAKQNAESQLRRAVMACLLWENLAYESAEDNSDNIALLIPKVKPETVAAIAIEARVKQKLRHVPLFIVCEMLKHDGYKQLVASVVPKIVTRVDQITDLIAMYWKGGKKTIPAQLKKGIAACFNKFDEYQFAKYDRNGAVKLRDAMFLCHPKPADQHQKELFAKIAKRELATPDTWEVALSTGKDKKQTWERLITENKLGALAFLRNLRGMKQADVSHNIIRAGLKSVKSDMLLPLNFLSAAKEAPEFKSDINELMLRIYKGLPKLSGYTLFIVDVSGSMGSGISGKSQWNRLQVAQAMAILAQEMCEEIDIFCTAGNDVSRVHSTKLIKYPKRGFDLIEDIDDFKDKLGGGGIFTRQCLEYMKENVTKEPDRIIIFSDSQDCDRNKSAKPAPFGKNNYIVDVSAHKNGINYKDVWSAEVSGWSEHFLSYIASYEGLENKFNNDIV